MRILCLSLYVYISLPLPHCNSTCTDSPPIQYASFKKKKKILFLFRERGREKQGEKHRCTRYFDWSPLACPQLGTWPASQACALTRNEPPTSWFTGPCSIHWAILSRASCVISYALLQLLSLWSDSSANHSSEISNPSSPYWFSMNFIFKGFSNVLSILWITDISPQINCICLSNSYFVLSYIL